VIEIRDGLIRLGPHLGEEWSAKALEPAALALHLRRVAEDVRQGRSQPCSGTPVAHGGSEAEEVASLVALSQAVRALPAGAA
jgi:hypothetical protein